LVRDETVTGIYIAAAWARMGVVRCLQHALEGVRNTLEIHNLNKAIRSHVRICRGLDKIRLAIDELREKEICALKSEVRILKALRGMSEGVEKNRELLQRNTESLQENKEQVQENKNVPMKVKIENDGQWKRHERRGAYRRRNELLIHRDLNEQIKLLLSLNKTFSRGGPTPSYSAENLVLDDGKGEKKDDVSDQLFCHYIDRSDLEERPAKTKVAKVSGERDAEKEMLQSKRQSVEALVKRLNQHISATERMLVMCGRQRLEKKKLSCRNSLRILGRLTELRESSVEELRKRRKKEAQASRIHRSLRKMEGKVHDDMHQVMAQSQELHRARDTREMQIASAERENLVGREDLRICKLLARLQRDLLTAEERLRGTLFDRILIILKQGSLDSDRRFTELIDETLVDMEKYDSPVLARMSIQFVIAKKYVEDIIHLKENVLLSKYLSDEMTLWDGQDQNEPSSRVVEGIF
jgi:hypothetical protein